MSDSKVIGFIGFGAMGKPICKHFIENGYFVLAWNRTKEIIYQWIKDNNIPSNQIKVVNTPKECLDSPSGIVFSCVSNDHALRSIVCDKYGILESLGPDGVHVCFFYLYTYSSSSLKRGEGGVVD